MNLLGRLTATNSRIDKQRILKGISELEYRTFAQACDPYYVYNMKFSAVRSYNLGEPSTEMFELLTDLLAKKWTGTAAKRKVEAFAETSGDLVKLVINKDLRCGVTATTFNVVYPGAIPQFKVQLAKEVPLDKLKYPVLLQIKYDGVRIIILNKEGEVKFFTRNGKEVSLPYISKWLESRPYMNYMIDTEVTLLEGKMEDRTKVSGMINSAMHGGMIEEESLVFNCFDFMQLSSWEAASCDEIYDIRFAVLKAALSEIRHEQLVLADTNEAHSKEAVDELYNAVIDMGYEGLILKQAKHLYTFKRSKDWVKLKEIKTADLTCYAIQAGEGKYEGFIGALLCKGKVDGKDIKVSVGSGLKDIERSMRESYFINQTIEVKYNTIIQDSVTKEWSLFLPRYVMTRFDK